MYRVILLTISSFFLGFSSSDSESPYEQNYVEVSTVRHNGHSYKTIYMERGRSGGKIKAKYFAAKDPNNGNSVPSRFDMWSDQKGVICVTSGTYMDSYVNPKPIGLTVDNGIVVNRGLQPDMDGLVIVYATGGVVATNIEDKDLTVQGGMISGVPLDLRGNSMHLASFLNWCEQMQATVFQTHLLIYKDEITISSYNSSSDQRERRFLAVGTDEDGQVVHCIVHSPEYTTLYEGTKRVKTFLNQFKEMEVIFMVNLDTGAQDVFNLFRPDGTIDPTIAGQKPLNEAVNLLVYYYD